MGTMKTHLDLFSGIGGFALACRWAGIETIGFAEIDDYASRVLAKNFPGVTNYGDVRNVPGSVSAWLITGGFPCQPFSVAGKRAGATDDRWLWPEMAGVIERVRPRWVLGENVPGIIRMELDTVLSDLERLDYTAWPIVIPAVGVDAPHRRERVWIVAYSESSYAGRGSGDISLSDEQETPERSEKFSWLTGNASTILGNTSRSGFGGQHRRRTGAQLAHGCENVADAKGAAIRPGLRTDESEGERWGRSGDSGQSGDVSNANDARCTQQRRTIAAEPQHAAAECSSRWQPEPELGRMAHGIPRRVDRLRGLGNAIVPQVAYQLINIMMDAEASMS